MPQLAIFDKVSNEVATILDRALSGVEISNPEARRLATAQGTDLIALGATADRLRQQQVGDVVTYVINRNINFTNVCIKHCTFCAFSRTHREEAGYMLPQEEIMRRVSEAVDLGATEVCLQAGLAPKMDGWLYVDLCRTIRQQFPSLHIHAFSPEEVLYGATRANVSIEEYLLAFREAGLNTLPGTSAEILLQEVRDQLAPGRITVDEWLTVIRTAHKLGIRTTSTIMFGHLETVDHWVHHLALLRDIQRETGGFSEFVPLSFVHQEAPLYRKKLRDDVRPGPTGAEVIRMHALARIMLGPHLRNIQASWVKEGPRLAQTLLLAGCNDLGGTLINESISTSAGAQHGQLVPPRELRRMIRDLGRTPAQRTTLYDLKKVYEENDDSEIGVLDQVDDSEGRFGSYQRLASSKDFRYVHPSAVAG